MKPSTIAFMLAVIAPALSQADTLVIPLGQQQAAQSSEPLPQRGMSTTAVLDRYGQPGQRHEAVGKPPIRRWDYAGFSVYFEHDHVVHSVRQHHRRASVSP